MRLEGDQLHPLPGPNLQVCGHLVPDRTFSGPRHRDIDRHLSRSLKSDCDRRSSIGCLGVDSRRRRHWPLAIVRRFPGRVRGVPPACHASGSRARGLPDRRRGPLRRPRARRHLRGAPGTPGNCWRHCNRRLGKPFKDARFALAAPGAALEGPSAPAATSRPSPPPSSLTMPCASASASRPSPSWPRPLRGMANRDRQLPASGGASNGFAASPYLLIKNQKRQAHSYRTWAGFRGQLLWALILASTRADRPSCSRVPRSQGRRVEQLSDSVVGDLDMVGEALERKAPSCLGRPPAQLVAFPPRRPARHRPGSASTPTPPGSRPWRRRRPACLAGPRCRRRGPTSLARPPGAALVSLPRRSSVPGRMESPAARA